MRETDYVITPNGRFLVGDSDTLRHLMDGLPRDHAAVFDRYITPESHVLEFGGHCGFYTMYFARRAARVTVYEPQLRLYLMLCGNLALNGCWNVRPYNVAAYDVPCTMVCAPEDKQHVGIGSVRVLDGGLPDYDGLGSPGSLMFVPGYGEVQAIRADEHGLAQVNFIKSDAQGADLRALQGAFLTIQMDRPVIFFEWCEYLAAHHQNTWADYTAFFDEVEYTLEKVGEGDSKNANYVAVPK